MIRDPLYRQILSGLEGPLDPDLFEQCAADLLRTVYPTLVPIRGGTDSGMDGAIADGEGEPFPLVTTTSKDVIGNLTRNLKSYLKGGGTRRKVVLASSQTLTQRRRKNLHVRANELGFLLIQIHDRAAIANLLCHDPKWCKELLGLTSEPPALSAIPRTERPLLTNELVGRETDLVWLRQTNGDRLIVGQPGSGKTFLLRKLAIEGIGLFAVSQDRGEIAGAYRQQQPEVLIVDDAHMCRELLLDLKQLREELSADFSILASSWPGDRNKIAQALNLPESNIHTLGLLTRDEIVEVVNAAGIRGPDGLVREIVDQAEGRPGLAVTLTQICLQGGVQKVARGEALRESILNFFEAVGGHRTTEILAAFAIGGDAGMAMHGVAEGLDLKLVDVREVVTKLAGGGVILEVNQDRLSVRPVALRHALVRDVFFAGAAALPVERLLAQAPSQVQTARTLIGATARGAAVPRVLLTHILQLAQLENPWGMEEAWKEFASLGRNEASWILKHHPEKLITVAQPALHRAPEITIPLLLERAVGDQRQLHSTPEHPLRLIEDWIHTTYRFRGWALEQRQALLQSARSWLLAGGNVDVGLRAFQSVMSPGFRFFTVDPGVGNKGAFHSGYPSIDEILAIQDLWPEVLKTIKTVRFTDWEPVRNIVEAWAYPGRIGISIPAETYDTMRIFADQMLRDVVPLAKDRFGVLRRAKRVAEDIDSTIEIQLDLAFEALYPLDDLDDWKSAEERQKTAVRKLAEAWSALSPTEVVQKIVRIEQEAQLMRLSGLRWTPLLCAEIAEDVVSPDAWVQAMIDADSGSDLVAPFLRKAAEIGKPGWIELAIACLEQPTLRTAAISLVLTLSAPPEHLLTQVLSRLEGYGELIWILCARSQVSEDVVKRLLHHGDIAIASAAAKGEWDAEPRGSVRSSLHSDWRDVVVRTVYDDYWLSEVLKCDPLLAYDWLRNRTTDQSLEIFTYQSVRGDAIKAAVSVLDVNARRRILRQVPATFGVAELIKRLIGDNLTLYQELLRDKRLKDFHLVPLLGDPEGIWIEKAKLALDMGYRIEEVAEAVYGYSVARMWSGDESALWAEWVEKFDRLCLHEDACIRKVGEVGRAKAAASRDRALEQERLEAIYGIDRYWGA